MAVRFNLLAYVRCLLSGHHFVSSRARPGYWTCKACGLRKKQ